MDDHRKYFSLLALLLQYPDDDLRRQLSAVEDWTAGPATGGQGASVAAFLDELKSRPPLELQKKYTAAFDLNPSTTLNFTYHLWKDGEKRSAVLANLEKIYRDAGYERISHELPDYLPLMLEFLSVRPDADGVDLIWACLQEIRGYIERLEAIAPAYAALLQPLAPIVDVRDTAGHFAGDRTTER